MLSKTQTFFLIAILVLAGGPAFASDQVNRIAFGSCLKQHRPQPVWEAVLASDPDIFLFLGDNVYIDSTDPGVMREQYAKLAAEPGYQRLRSIATIHGIWDDHDYGRNDAGDEFPAKRASKEAFMEFFDIPAASPRGRRPGIYDALVHGPAGRRVQIIMLDTRWFRSPLKRGAPTGACPRIPYVPTDDPRATLLGKDQWRWLGEQLRRPAELRIIASSIQVIPDRHCFEKWGNFPSERERLFRLIQETRANGVVLVSGDRHFAEISRLGADGAGYPLFEITSSGLNSARRGKIEVNRFRTSPHNFRVDNFGFIRVDWADDPPLLSLQIRDVEGSIMQEERVRLSDLKHVVR